MPYTPPSHSASPASTRTSSPTLSRNPSYSHDLSAPPPVNRPHLPRSVSSATHLNRHRQNLTASSKDAELLPGLSNLRQSPPPVNGFKVPTGAIASPPDSSENSDDEKQERSTRRRQVEHTWNELQQAVRSMSIKRDPSPIKTLVTSSEPHTQVTSPSSLTPSHLTPGSRTPSHLTPTSLTPTSLTPEARKISHSRSSTETAIVISGPHLTDSSNQTSGDNSDDEDDIRTGKPPLVRKKSGELVKPALRPSSRRRYSSMPGTPTYSKSVHFNDNGNQTRHFLQVDKPSAISVDSSPVETYEDEVEYPFDKTGPRTEWHIKLTNFPENRPERKFKPIWVDRIFLSADTKSLIGQVAVANLSFHKAVVARFTLDYWKTTSEVSAEFNHDIRPDAPKDGYDRFNFTIRLSDQANLESKTLLLCVRYNVNGQEYWDNNDNLNYQIDFVKRSPKVNKHLPQSTLGARPVSAIPRSRHSPPASRGRTPSVDEDHTRRFDAASTYHFGSTAQDLLGEDTTTIKFKQKPKRAHAAPVGQVQPSHGLGGRYDFGASLSAALSNAQDKLGKQSGLMAQKGSPKKDSGYFAQDAPGSGSKEDTDDRPDSLATDRPAIGSAQYQDLVSKFCYFTPTPSGKLSPLPGNNQTASNNTDGSSDLDTSDRTTVDSDNITPTAQHLAPSYDGTNEKMVSSHHEFVERAASPVAVARTDMKSKSRGTSPVKIGFPYFKRDGYLSESATPTAIHG